jgi:hypothetical protein
MIAEGMDERVARKVIDMAEILFLREFQADTYKAFEPFSWEQDDEDNEAAGISEITESAKATGIGVSQTQQMPTPGGYWGRTFGMKEDQQPNQQMDKGKEDAEGAEEPEGILSEELEQARKEVKALRAALYKERREASDDRAKYEHELKALRMEHRELADLRSLVFNMNAADPSRLEKVEKQITYPYSTKKRTVVFGGHDSFLRAFKPLLPDVKFVDTEQYGFAPEIIRNADVVWVQTNCISHSQYNNITRVVRQYGIQLRYFGFASAEKCAEQLVTEDMK